MKLYIKYIFLALLLCLVSQSELQAQNQYKLFKGVGASGGLYSNSSNNGLKLFCTVGQFLAEKSININKSDFVLYNGFWSRIDSIKSGIEEDPISEFKKIKNYPNPFSFRTNIVYELPGYSKVSLVVYDVSGNEIARLFDGYQDQGQHSFEFGSIDRNGVEFASGSYLYELSVKPAAMIGNAVFSPYSIRNVMVLAK